MEIRLMNFFKKHWWCVLYGILLTAFTAYIALDTFVIERVIINDLPDISFRPQNSQQSSSVYESSDLNSDSIGQSESEVSSENSEPQPPPKPMEPIITANSYLDDNIMIQIVQTRVHDTECYVAEVRLSSAEYLKTAFAKGVYGRNSVQYTSTIAKNVNAILAINGDYYGIRERGYVIRNGNVYRESVYNEAQEDLIIYPDGSFRTIKETEVPAQQLYDEGAWQVFSFGPALVKDGKPSVKSGQDVAAHMSSNPRTAIGIIDELHYIFVVSDGRTAESAGLSLLQLAELMIDFGVTTGYNLDGGGSSTMVFNGKIVNKPTSGGNDISERGVSDIVYIDRGAVQSGS